jgi:hypothetical protein
MPYYDGRWHMYSEAERRAYGELMRDELRKKWHAKFISKHGLKTERLWTDKAIVEFLSKPRQAGAIKAWLRKDVLAAEKTMGFKAWMKQRKALLVAKGKLPPEQPKPTPKPRKVKERPLPDNVIPITRAVKR